jgi:N-acetylglutamate synthase-like GNAT family acetyltransferase
VTETAEATRRSLAGTYCALARQIGSTDIAEHGRYITAKGPFPHPICNFAIFLQEPAQEDFETIELKAASLENFNLYHFQPLEEEEVEPPDTWRRVYSLHQMSVAPHPQGRGTLEMIEPPDRTSRLTIARFMAEQFFTTQAPQVRTTIARATADAPELQLFSVHDKEHPAIMVGAVMLYSVADTIGLYNLCVAPHERGAGIGSAIVRSVLGRATAAGASVVLQCDGSLLEWYSGLGFAEIGQWNVYNVAKTDQAVIMS